MPPEPPTVNRSSSARSHSRIQAALRNVLEVMPCFRWSILRTLLKKEALRHVANRGGIVLAFLLVVAALLLTMFRRGETTTESLSSGVQYCFVDYWEDSQWLTHLRTHVPPELRDQMQFRPGDRVPTHDGIIVYPTGSGAIQIRAAGEGGSGPCYKVWIWQPADSGGMAPFKEWFWKETANYNRIRAYSLASPSVRPELGLPELVEEQSIIQGGLDSRSGIATALVLFALFFVCVYLLPSLTCEERERGVLLAQALSPASPFEILLAKLLLYPVIGVALAALIAGITNPSILSRPIFWLGLIAAALGSLGIGLTIASLAKTQRAASMGALCYTLVVALMLFICQRNNIPGLPYIALEYHCPRVLHAAFSNAVYSYHWGNLAGAYILALLWIMLATFMFRRWGWQ
jgi:hypothetical protein